jgi:hypothetical protein
VAPVVALIVLLAVIVVLLVVMPSVLMDYWWYQDVGFMSVFFTRIWARWALFGVATAGSFAAIYLVATLSFRQGRQAASKYPASPVASQIPQIGKLPILLIGLLVSLGFGFVVSRNWLTVLAFFNKVPFGTTDPIFGLDLSFHVFTFPFLTTLIGALIAVAFICVLVGLPLAVLTYARYPNIEVFERAIHLRICAAAIFILAGIRLYIARYGLLRASNAASAIPVGAEFMDVTYRLPFYLAASVLLIISGFAVFFFTGRLRRQNWRSGAIAVRWVQGAGLVVGLLLLFQVVIFPIIDSVSVTPNEPGIQEEFINRHIEHTLTGYSLDDVDSIEYDPTYANLTVDSALNSPTIKNARILDYKPTAAVFQQKQEIRSYYQFIDPDVDRYNISGEKTEVMIGAREMMTSKLQPAARTWANEHLQYTHGFGVVIAPVNTVDEGGLPSMVVRDIPPSSEWPEIQIEQPRIYFGELTSDYIVVSADGIDEFDYPSGDTNMPYRYEGDSGIQLKNALRKTIAAVHTGSTKMLFSGYISGDSRLMIRRQILERIRLVAPFLIVDSDPYPFVENGRIYWMSSGITYTDRYPYSEYSRIQGERVNYVRDSVKIITDAYTGEMWLYMIDETDPIVQTFSKIFPDILIDGDEMPQEFRRHMRYPEDLFEIEMSAYSTYHMTNYKTFYNKEDVWTPATEQYQSASSRVEPYNILLALDSGQETEFALIQPFTPKGKQNMIAWISAMQDPENYGQIRIFRFPKGILVPGPMQIEAVIDQDEEISKSISLWSTGGSRVIRGNTLVLPVQGSVLYIEPLYLSAEQSEIPELKKVIAVHQNNVVMADNLLDAVSMVLSGTEPPSPPSGETLPELVAEYFDHLDRAEDYRVAGDFIRYGEELAAAEDARQRIEEMLAEEG